MPALNDVFCVLKHNLNECSIVSTHHSGIKMDRGTIRLVRDTSQGENPTDLEVVSKLKRGVSRDE